MLVYTSIAVASGLCSNQLYIFQHKQRLVWYPSLDFQHKTFLLYKFSGLHLSAFMCVNGSAAEPRSVKAINYSWCTERWTQEDSYPRAPYFMVREHYVQHSEVIHHETGDLSFGSVENISQCMSVFVCVLKLLQASLLHSSLLRVCVFHQWLWSKPLAM